MHKVSLEIFEGPLDLLLYLVRKEEVDIYEISIEKITKQYLDYIETFKLLNVELASEFIVMAANLMYIKSRSLLPVEQQPPGDEAEEDDPRWDLIRQLVEYKKFKDAAGFLHAREEEQSDLFATQSDKRSTEEGLAPLAELNIFELIRAFQRVLSDVEKRESLTEIVQDRYTVSDRMEHLLERLAPGQRTTFHSLFHDASTKSELVVTFIALLELIRLKQLRIVQEQVLGEIKISRPASAAIALEP